MAPATRRGQFILLSNLAVDELDPNTSLWQLVHWLRNDNFNQLYLFQMTSGDARIEKVSLLSFENHTTDKPGKFPASAQSNK